jgi:anaerobic magnesium-protoporphyrin IX monomethyl ester cyclase
LVKLSKCRYQTRDSLESDRMNILLIQPAYRLEGNPSYFPLGLGYISAVLREKGHKITTLDIEANRYSDDALEGVINGLEFDAVGISALITKYKYLKRVLIPLLKKRNSNAPIVVGNSLATTVPQMCISHVGADVAVIDEGEETAVELFDSLEKGYNPDTLAKVDGIAFKKEYKPVINSPRKFIDDLDKLPFPAWDLFPVTTYLDNMGKENVFFLDAKKPLRGINISTVRGCPFQCEYCSKVFGRTCRWRSAQSIIDEISILYEKYKIQYVAFSDDLFIANRKRTFEFCELLKKLDIGIKFQSSARVNLVDEELLGKMADAGCVALLYGVESGSQKILNNMKKNATVEQAKNALLLSRKAGIIPTPSFMVGYPGETHETIDETVRFCKEMEVSSSFFFTTPYPGTPLWDIAKKMGKILDDDAYFENLGEMAQNLLVNFTDIPDDELVRIKKESDRITTGDYISRFFRLNKQLGTKRALKMEAILVSNKLKRILNKNTKTKT